MIHWFPLIWEPDLRGSDERTGALFSYVDLEARVPRRHPLRKIRQIVNDALATLDGEFSALYASEGRPSIAPEKLLRASLVQAFFSVRSERQLMEQLDYNLMFRWFVGLGIDDPVWDVTVFTKNRARLLDAEVAAKFMNHRRQGATGSGSSKVRRAGTTRMRAAPIPMPSSIARALAWPRSSATSGMRWPRTGTA